MPRAVPTLDDLIQRAAALLPAQGPITSFVHHNTLHALESIPFDDALRRAGAALGCATFLSEKRYRAEIHAGRIRDADIDAVLREELGARAEERVAGLARVLEIRRTMLHDPVRRASDAQLIWKLESAGALRTFRVHSSAANRDRMVHDTRQWVLRELRSSVTEDGTPQPLGVGIFERFGLERIEDWSRKTWDEVTLTLLWRVCLRGVRSVRREPSHRARAVRPRDRFVTATGEDPDLLVNALLIPFTAAFTDQGLARRRLPDRRRGFIRALAGLQGTTPRWLVPWRRGLRAALSPLVSGALTPLQSIEESLADLGVADHERGEFMECSLMALRGWGGMLRQLESRPDRVAHPVPCGTLVEFLAARLICDRLALAELARRELSYRGPLDQLDTRLDADAPSGTDAGDTAHTTAQRAFGLFLTAQSLGWAPSRLHLLAEGDWTALGAELDRFDEWERRRVLQLAYERRFRVRSFEALGAHAPRSLPIARADAQVLCCLDDREESFRRHLEELAPTVETFGLAGYFGVAMRYRGVDSVHSIPLCPVSIEPTHEVIESPFRAAGAAHARRSRRAHRLGVAAHLAHTSSRGLLLGMAASILGATMALPLLTKVLFPRLAARLRVRAGAIVRATVPTDVNFDATRPGDSTDEHTGFTPDEMADIVAEQLGDSGVAACFSRLVVVVGHGSSSLNNPHEAAHDCGACGGGRGGPNARVFARMANDARARELLHDRGFDIPTDTVFLGAYHDTCADRIDFYDVDLLPQSHVKEQRWLRRKLHLACEANAHERCRRFVTAGPSPTRSAARRHVEGRATDLGQPRPEYGHAGNALCIVGRRSRTRGLFLDRRAFLASYDPTLDGDSQEQAVLTRCLRAVAPVCAGINLEYYFSTVDPVGFGAGTKLPHNISALLGVMDGASSDLRTGLPWQMVEIHEPMRLLLVVETTPERLERVLMRDEALRRLCDGAWVQLATLDPDSPEIHMRRGGSFVPVEREPNARTDAASARSWTSSVSWYSGLREDLGFTSIAQPAANGHAKRTQVSRS